VHEAAVDAAFAAWTTGPLTIRALRMPPSAVIALYWLNGVMDTWAQAGP